MAAIDIAFIDADLAALAAVEGVVTVFWRPGENGPTLTPAAARADALTEGQVTRALTAKTKAEVGDVVVLTAPHGLAADALALCSLGTDPLTQGKARRLGAALSKALSGLKARKATLRVEGLGGHGDAGGPGADAALSAELALGLSLRSYRFNRYKSERADAEITEVAFAGAPTADAEAAFAPLKGVAAGVTLTRDLVNEPANVLTPVAFAERAAALAALGVEIEVLDEARLEEIGMRALLAVGQGSEQPSRVVAMRWNGADDPAAPPLCYVGKGVCFDTGGVSLKPPAGMEEMTMDMGGAGVVTGVMRALAERGSKANVVGIIGLVENMPDGKAQRPGDIVTALAGKSVEVINTDAEGRLVLCDLMWWAQDVYKPRAMVDLATLTGAIIIALGHHNAGLFANDDAFAAQLLAAAGAEEEGLWRMPLGEAYDKQLKSRLADMKNVGGRAAGSITAAQFLQRFVRDGLPWAHIDIAGVALTKEDGPLWPKGASGWGVATLTRLAEETFAK